VPSERRVKLMEWALWGAYERAPRSVDGVLRFVRAHVLPLFDWRVPIQQITGRTRGGAHARVIFAGHWDERDYLVNRFFSGTFEVTPCGTTPLHGLAGALRRLRADADLTIARVARPLIAHVFGSDPLCVPESVDCEIAVSKQPPALPLATKTARHNAKVVHDNELTYAISRSVRDCTSFIAEMYEPYLAERHGARGVRKEAYRVRRQFRQGALLLVLHRGVAVAGGTLIVDAPVLRTGVLGTAGGSKDYLKLGVVSALYLFSAEYARQRGLERFNLGASSPSLADGVLTHKCAWGARVVDRQESLRDYVLGWGEPTPAVAEFLAHTPLIVRDGGGLSVLAALPVQATAGEVGADASGRRAPTAGDFVKLSKQAAAAGLKRVIVLGDPAALPPSVWAVQPVAAERIRASAYALEASLR
jgi:hypothetical protein